MSREVSQSSDTEFGKISLQKLISSWDELQCREVIKANVEKTQGSVLEKIDGENYLT